MSEFLINLMPIEARVQARKRSNRRLMNLMTTLAICSTTGLAAHSYVQWRGANAARDVALCLRENAQNIDDIAAALAAERNQLQAQLATHGGIEMPVEASDVVATITHLLPQSVRLEGLKITAIEPRVMKGKATDDNAAAVPPQPAYYEVRLVGVSTDESAAASLSQLLASTVPFSGVARQEQRTRTGPSGTEHVFTLSFHADPFSAGRASARQVVRNTR